MADYAQSLRDSDALMPGRVTKTGERVIDFAHVGRIIGIPLLAKASYTQAQAVLLRSGLPIDDDAYLSTPITATIGTRPWHPGPVAYRRTWQLVRHLHTACLILVAYLSGARPAEVLNLQRGCITRDEATDLYLMSGGYFKNAVNQDGAKEPEGLQRRDPWVVVAPVAQAVAVLERLHNEQLLFTHRTDPTRTYVTRRAGGAARSSQVVTDDIHRFITYVNQLCAHHHVELIPSDSHGALTITRFRRTLAWFIRRRPRGLVAGSIQYGHVHTRMIQGYAGAYDSGFPDELAFEEFLSRLEQFADDEHALHTGEHVSGPAAQTYRNRIRAGNDRFAGHVVTTTRQARDLLANPSLQIHHGEAMTCVFDATKAACQLQGHRDDPMVTPDIDDCQPNCRNLARTDRDIIAVRRYRTRLADTVKDTAAPPIRHQRELQELERIDALIKDHDEHC
ncbi:hypothetical protein [Mycobacterium adipatum]|uniref:hypothetical protein n=1 Tax=Mycobacterium adipatum TaxID=1682113 RepID=UPI0012E74D96|nr:hypothetical protein [Mycobacterium adipatum]